MQYPTLEACRAALAGVVLAMDEDQAVELLNRARTLLAQPRPESAADPPAASG